MKLNAPVTLRLRPKEGHDSDDLIPLTVPASFFSVSQELGQDERDPLQWDREAAKKLSETPLTKEFKRALETAFEVSPFGYGKRTIVDESIRKAMHVSPIVLSVLCSSSWS